MFKRFGLGFATGYVFGARAGQKRYDEMTEVAQRVVDLPVLQRLSDQARGLVTPENGRRLVDQIRARARHDQPDRPRPAGRRGSGPEGSPRSRQADDEDAAAGDRYDPGEADYSDSYESDDEEGSYDSEDDGSYEPEEDDSYDAEDDGSYEPEEDDSYDAEEDSSYDADEDSSYDADEDHSDGDEDRSSERPRRSTGRVRAAASAALERGRVD